MVQPKQAAVARHPSVAIKAEEAYYTLRARVAEGARAIVNACDCWRKGDGLSCQASACLGCPGLVIPAKAGTQPVNARETGK